MFDDGRLGNKDRSCPASEDVVAYLQQELTLSECADFEKHCSSCDACRLKVEEHRELMTRMCDVPVSVISRDLAPLILARIPADEWEKGAGATTSFLFMPKLVRVAAALAVLVSAGAILFVVAQHGRNKSAMFASAGESKWSGRNEAISGGLAWLAAHQEPDGSWDAERWGAKKEHTVGVTALSILAFIGKDVNPGSGPHADVIRRGIRYLVDQQDVSGRVGPVCANAMYNHGMATVALMRSRRLDLEDRWKKAGDRAIDFVCSSQQQSGGWGYSMANKEDANTSVTVWQLQSLMLAESSGRDDLAPRIERSMAWLRSMVDGSGKMGYSRADESPNGYDTLTAAGILCLLATDASPQNRDRAEQLVKSLESAASRQGRTVDYYRWYFVTHALQTAGSEASKKFAGQLQETLIAQQARTGTGAGSWELDDRWTPAGGRIYTTSMAVLSLE